MTCIPRADLEDKVGFHWALKCPGCLGMFWRRNPAFVPDTPLGFVQEVAWENTPLLKPCSFRASAAGRKRLHILQELGRDSSSFWG